MTVVEVLYFEGCPGAPAAVAVVEGVVQRAGLEGVEVRRVLIEDAPSAAARRFLGSPSIRVDGRDVEPGAESRTAYGLQCRIYSVGGRLQNTPAPAWVATALGVRDDA